VFGKRPQYYLMPLGMLVQCFIPRWLALRIAGFLARAAFPLLKGQRRVVADNLRRVLGRELNAREENRLVRRVLRNLAIVSADLLRAPLLARGERFRQLVRHRRSPGLDATLRQGKAAILVTAHVGNWDLAGVFLAYEGYPAVAVFERITRGMSEAFNRFRGLSGMGLIGLDERSRMDAALRAGRLFVLLGDRDLKGTGKVLPWFTGRRTFPRGAAAFSLRYKVPIVIGYFVLVPGDKHARYVGIIEPPLVFKPGGDSERDVADLTALIVKELERVVAQYPDQWFVFQPRWLDSPQNRATGGMR
jgi:KDO2-lipid IV(A) lauroyltransferase